MELICTTIAIMLLQAVAAAPKPNPSPAPTPFAEFALNKRQDSPILTGAFTANGGGVYDITSESGYIQIAGYQLTVGGPNALVGGDIVTLASNGVIANGDSIALATYTSTSSSVAATSSSSSTTASPSGSASEAASSTASSALAVATAVPVVGAAVVGGLLGLMVM